MVGYILMAVGAVGLLFSLIVAPRRRTAVQPVERVAVEERPVERY